MANSLDTKRVSAQIRGKEIDTVIGKLKYDAKGDVSNAEYVWYIWRNGKYSQM